MLKHKSTESTSADNPKEMNLLDLPDELIGVIGQFSSTPELAKLKHTSSRLHHLFKTELQERYAQLAHQLMSYVLNPTAENIDLAKAMIARNPQIMFVKTEGVELASGEEEYVDEATGVTRTRLVHRKIKCSPFQAALGTGLVELYENMATHFDKMQAGVETALKQMQEYFPNGFDYPPCEDEFNRHLTFIVKAISTDQDLIDTGTPSPDTQALIKQFRNYLLPKEVTQGHHFNLNYLIKALETYNQNWDPWNGNQLSLFWRQVIGYIERLVTTDTAQAFCQGLYNLLEEKQPQARSLSLHNYHSNSTISYFPAADSGSTGLGFDFGIEFSRARAAGRGGAGGPGRWPCALKNYVGQKQQRLTTCLRQLEQRAHPTTNEQPQAVHHSLK